MPLFIADTRDTNYTACTTVAQPSGMAVPMLSWALTFFVLAIVAAFFGFGGIAVAAADIAKIIFFLFVILFIGSMILRFTQSVDDAL